MKKRLVSIILLLCIIVSISFQVYGVEDLKVDAKSALLMDYNTGELIYRLNENDRLAPASITKIMTLLLGMESISSGKIKLDDQVVVSNYASSIGGSTVFLEAGEIQPLEELFKAISIRSANDAAVAVAEHISGTEDKFVQLMNQRAKELGMTNTRFENASGLPNKDHYISAYDVALMSKELIKHESVIEWLSTYMYDMEVGIKKPSIQTMVNTNRLIKEYEGANGIKTGSTNEAGFCLSGSAKRGDLHLISVVMGADSSKARFDETKKIFDYGFANYESISIGKEGDLITVLPIGKGKLTEVNLTLNRDAYILLPKGGEGKVTKELRLPNNLIDAPILLGQELGNLEIFLDGEKVDDIKLISNINIPKASFINILDRTVKKFIVGK